MKRSLPSHLVPLSPLAWEAFTNPGRYVLSPEQKRQIRLVASFSVTPWLFACKHDDLPGAFHLTDAQLDEREQARLPVALARPGVNFCEFCHTELDEYGDLCPACLRIVDDEAKRWQ